MRKLLTSVSAVAIAGLAAYGAVKAANLPLLSGPATSDPAAVQGSLNLVIQNINAGVTGDFAYVPGPVTNALGGAGNNANQVLASATIPTGTLVAVNNGYRARCAGISQALTNVNYGIVVGKAMNASIQGAPGTNSSWDMEIEWHAATSPVTANYSWMTRSFASDASGSATNFMAVNSGNDTNTTDNNAIFAVPVQCVVYTTAGGLPTGAATMMNFSIEQLR